MQIYIWYPILASMGMGFTFMNIPPVNRQFMELFGVGYDGLSWFLSGLFWVHALMQIPAGLIVDRGRPWPLMMIGLTICVAGNALPFLAPESLALATAMRGVVGVGTSLAFMALMKVLLLLTPGDRLVSVQGLQGAGFSLGFVLPYLILPRLGPTAWPYAYLVSIFFLLPAMAAAFLLPRDRLLPSRPPRPAAEVKRALRLILSTKGIWFLGIFHGLSYGSLNNLGNWLPSILADLDNQGAPSTWAGAAALLLVLGTLGRAFGGSLRFWHTRERAVNRPVLVICLLYLVMGLAGQEYFVLGSALLMALACGCTYGGVFTLSAAAGAGYAATAMGLMNTIGNFFSVFMTLLFGYVRQHTGHFTVSLLMVGILGLGLWLLGRRLVAAVDRQTRTAAG